MEANVQKNIWYFPTTTTTTTTVVVFVGGFSLVDFNDVPTEEEVQC
jgi:hypothetical protein